LLEAAMPARASLKSVALAGICLMALAGLAVRAESAESLLIDLPLPQPVEAVDPGNTCIEPDAVMLQFRTEAKALGGRTMAMDSAIDQKFANEWRRRLNEAPVAVGLILLHAFADPDAQAQLVVDTVEFDVDGCAISRTLMPLDAWAILVKAAEGTPI
jgi:hypothetical protein